MKKTTISDPMFFFTFTAWKKTSLEKENETKRTSLQQGLLYENITNNFPIRSIRTVLHDNLLINNATELTNYRLIFIQ